MPLVPLVLIAREGPQLGPLGLKQLERQFSAGYNPQATAQKTDCNSFLCKRPVDLFLNFSLRGRFQVVTHLAGAWRRHAGFVHSLGLTTTAWYLPERSLYIVWSLEC